MGSVGRGYRSTALTRKETADVCPLVTTILAKGLGTCGTTAVPPPVPEKTMNGSPLPSLRINVCHGAVPLVCEKASVTPAAVP